MGVTNDERLHVAAKAEKLGYEHHPYVFGADGPDAYDCSGLAMVAWRGTLDLPHNTVAMKDFLRSADPGVYAHATADTEMRLRPGDLVFYYGYEQPNHVGVFVEIRHGLHVCAQATDPAHGSEVIRMRKYADPTAFGFVGHNG